LQISDDDIKGMTECVLDMKIVNAIYVSIKHGEVTVHHIKVRDIQAGMSLISQLLQYQEELE